MTAYYVVDRNSTLQDGASYTDPANGQTYTVLNIDSNKNIFGNYQHENVTVNNSTDSYTLANTLSTDVHFTPGTSTEGTATTINLQAPTGGAAPTYSVSFADPVLSGSLNPTINVPSANLGNVTLNGADTDGMTVNVGAGGRIGNVTGGNESSDNFTLNAGDGVHVGNISASGSAHITLGNNVTAGTIATGSGNDEIIIGDHASVSNIDMGSGANSLKVGANGTTGNISGGSGVDAIDIGNGTHTGTVSTGGGNDAIHAGTGAVLGDVDAGGGDDTIAIGDGGKAGSVNLSTGDDHLTLGKGGTVGDVSGGDGSDGLTLGDHATTGNLWLGNGGSMGDTVTGGNNVTVNGDITQPTSDHHSIVTFGDSLSLSGSVALHGGNDTFSAGAGSTIAGGINVGSVLSNDDEDMVTLGAGSQVGGDIYLGRNGDIIVVGDKVTLNGNWAINTDQGNDTIMMGDGVVVPHGLTMGNIIPNDDLLVINFGKGGEAEFKKALADQGFTDPDGDGRYYGGANKTFVWKGVTYHEIDYIRGTPPCFAAGTMIDTETGPRAIETLAVGDRVVTRDNGLQPIRWIGARKLSAADLTDAPNLRPIRIRRHALATNVPSTDLLVSPQHRILARSAIAQKMFDAPEVLVAAKQLCQLEGVDIADDVAEVTYVHMLFDRHEVVISNGAETESLFTGPEALKSVGPAARAEIFAIFPELAGADYTPPSARPLVSGRLGRKLVVRHAQNHKAFVA